MGIYSNTVDTYVIDDLAPNFSWQVGFNNFNIIDSGINFRVTVRPITFNEQYSRLPHPVVLYEETGIVINGVDNLGKWQFTFDKNLQASGGPYRDFQIVVEAHDQNGNTSAGNVVGTNNEDGWTAYPDGYDIVAVYNPRPSGIELTNHVPTQESGIGPYIQLSGPDQYSSKQYVDSNGNITIQFLSGALDSGIVGGYIYTSANAFPKTEGVLGTGLYGSRVQKSRFDFDPKRGYIHVPAAAFNARGAPYVFASVSFYDTIDAYAIENGIDVSTGLYVSNNAIMFNDSAAGSISLGGVVTVAAVQTTGYPGTNRTNQLIGAGSIELTRNSILGTTNSIQNITTIIYISKPLTGLGYTGIGGGGINDINGGYGGGAIYNDDDAFGGYVGGTNVIVSAIGVGQPYVLKRIDQLNVGDKVNSWWIESGFPRVQDPSDIYYDYNADNWRQVLVRNNNPIYIRDTAGYFVPSGTITKILTRSVDHYYKVTWTGIHPSAFVPSYYSHYMDENQVMVRIQFGAAANGSDLTGLTMRRIAEMDTGSWIRQGGYLSSVYSLSGIERIDSPTTIYCVKIEPYRTMFISGADTYYAAYSRDSVLKVAGSIYGH